MRYFGAILLLLVATKVAALPGDVVTSMPTPGPCPTGLAWDGKYLWVADRKTDILYQVDPTTGKVNNSITSPSFWPIGLACDGKYLWAVDMDKQQIFEIDTESGIVKKTINCPASQPQGLACNGKYLWVSDSRADKIYKVDTDDGTVVSSFTSPSSSPTGLCFDGKYLWVADRGKDEIYMMTDEGDVIVIISAPFHVPYGLTWDGKYLWNVDYESDSLYKIKVHDEEYYSAKREKDVVVEFTHIFGNYGPGTVKTLDFYIAVPTDLRNQKLLEEPEFNPKPNEFLTDRWDQRFAHYRFTDLVATKFVKSTMKVKARIYELRYYIFPEKVGSLKDIPTDIRKKWLADGSKYCINDPIIQRAVKEAVGDEKNPYWMARKIFKYVIDHMKYELTGGWERAPVVLSRGTGSCSEYSFVFIALCRAAGLPARYVGAVAQRGEEASWDRVFHRWTEVYIPPYGWIPVDPSGGDTKSTRGQAMAIGRVANRYLITTVNGGDSEYLGWTYNSSEEWEFEGQCEIYFDKIAEWSPLKETNGKEKLPEQKGYCPRR
ncbi:MAG TPA: transglutaminase [bacterium (Candidatus Stahlbacteria)]|nr:transglutaminase [Candidatus Stahlbacteria bacterium]